MRFDRCPKCNAAASVPLVIGLPLPKERVVLSRNSPDVSIGRLTHVGKKPANSLCLCCRHRWHSEFMLEFNK